MNNYFFRTLELLAIMTFAYISIDILYAEDWRRFFTGFFLLGIYMYISTLFRKRIGIVTPSYLFLYLIGMCVNILYPYYFSNSVLDEYSGLNYSVLWPQDHFYMYAAIIFVFYIIVLVYLSFKSEQQKFVMNFQISNNEMLVVLFSNLILCLPVAIFIGYTNSVICGPGLMYFSLIYFLYKNNIKKYKDIKNIYIYIGLLVGLIGLLTIVTKRFLIIQYIFPIIMAVFIMKQADNEKYNFKKHLLYCSVFVTVIIAYGIISEMVKLNIYYGGDFSISNINFDFIQFFAIRQIYRMFGVWTHLGGNIIDYVNYHGYFYGLTYIKSLAYLFDFEYISLPDISAGLISAGYAQPGLLAESYANFGIVGSIIGLTSMFLFMELVFNFFVKAKPYNMIYYLIFSVFPFTAVLLDGGTVNSIIVFYVYCFINFFSVSVWRCYFNGHKRYT